MWAAALKHHHAHLLKALELSSLVFAIAQNLNVIGQKDQILLISILNC